MVGRTRVCHIIWSAVVNYSLIHRMTVAKWRESLNATKIFRQMTRLHCVSKNPCHYVFDNNLNSRRPIVIIFGTVVS